jgi:hypothetical protein
MEEVRRFRRSSQILFLGNQGAVNLRQSADNFSERSSDSLQKLLHLLVPLSSLVFQDRVVNRAGYFLKGRCDRFVAYRDPAAPFRHAIAQLMFDALRECSHSKSPSWIFKDDAEVVRSDAPFANVDVAFHFYRLTIQLALAIEFIGELLSAPRGIGSDKANSRPRSDKHCSQIKQLGASSQRLCRLAAE